jgi:3'5'-cyclic nucleotide phosphodiesterase
VFQPQSALFAHPLEYFSQQSCFFTVIVAKGKGELQTFWLAAAMNGDASSVRDSTSSSLGPNEDENEISALTVHDAKTLRLINWNVDLLLRLLKHIVARRREGTVSLSKDMLALESRFCDSTGSGPIEEVKEIIALPRYTERRSKLEPESLVLDPSVAQQMFEYVSTIATLYRDNPFHNFAHASHVAMSVSKLLSRIVAPSDLDSPDIDGTKNATLHDYTYGITSDPLTQFSCVVSALIHDVDHPGVSNAQLVKENAEMAAAFAGKSAAEQNSVSLAWDLLQDDKYRELRRTIYSTDEELARFRQIVVNAVMATDIVDKDLKMIRNLRWDRAFATEQAPNSRDMINRKATIVIEHLIQASDVAHTMQHWHVYRKWNELFFLECHKAFVEGRADHDPLDGWYDGELGFFDYYIIPLAKKLKDCGVFGVSCDEYLNYALQNRREWEKRGRDVVNEMRELVRPKVACSKSARGLASTSASAKYFI